MATEPEKPFSEVVNERRATPSFDGAAIPDEHLAAILAAGLKAPSSYNLQPWRFVVVRTPEQRRRLRAACFNQAKVEEASVVIVACGDADGWRNGDLDEVLRMGRAAGMPENFAHQARINIPNYLGNHPNLGAWLNRQVTLAFATMMWMAESLGYNTAPMEGCEEDKVRSVLKLPMNYQVVALLAIGHGKGQPKFNGGRFSMGRLVFGEEHGLPLKI
ncbi:MAG TPA: nitroreductase family protein [Acidobacteriaceae bacterium]